MSLFKDLLECQNAELNKNKEVSEVNESKETKSEVESEVTSEVDTANESVSEELEESIILEDLNVTNETEILSLSKCESCGALHESTDEKCECGGELTEAMKLVVRAGKIVKKRVKSKKARLSSKQKAALAKARKKAHSTGANKARAKSMKVRSKRIHESDEDFECPVCDYIGPMDQDDDGYYVCPECGSELELTEVDETVEESKKEDTKVEESKKEDTKVEESQETKLDPSLVKYVETLDIDKEIVAKGDKAVKAFLIKEYGIYCK